jgi:hypothetical protein
MNSQFIKNSLRWIPGAIISLGLIAAIVYSVNWATLWNAIRHADYGLLSLALILSVAWIIMRGVVWRTLLQNKTSYSQTFFTLCEGYLLNAFLPFRLGEIGRAFLLSRKTNLAFMEILPTIVIERVLDLAFSAMMLAISVPFVVGAEGADRIAFIVGGIVISGLIVLYVLARNQARAIDLFHRVSKDHPSIQKMGGEFLESFFTGLAVFNDLKLFIAVLVWMTINWSIAIVQYYLTTAAFFPQAQPIWGMFTLGAAAFGAAIPSLPGAVGTFEGAMTGAITLLAGDQSSAFAAALVMRFFNYISAMIGAYALMREGQTLGGVYRQLMSLRNK